MITRLVPLFVLASALLTGCGTGVAVTEVPRPGIVLLRATEPGQAPRQGLLVDQERSTLLVGLDGRPYARLDRAHPAWATADGTARNAAFKGLAEAVPTETLLEGPRGRWYRWDSAAARLEPLAEPRLRLAEGVVAAAETRATDETSAYEVYISISRNGRTIVPPSRHLRFVSNRLVASQTWAVDLVTETRWSFSRNCVSAGARRAELFLVCTSASLDRPTRVIALGARRKRKLGTLPKGLFAYEGMLSPDGRYVAVNLSPGCGPSYSFLVPTSGGRARPLGRPRRSPLKSSPARTLGWTRDNRVVVFVARPGSCEAESRSGVYRINPRTLGRRFLYPIASAMWNPSHG